MHSIKLSPTDCKESVNFGNTILKNRAQSNKDFGSDLVRGSEDNLVDIIEGKLAEVGFSYFFKSITNYDLTIDFKIYPGILTIDYGQDIDGIRKDDNLYYSKSRIDIKATRGYSKWLLVESHKFWADAYVLVKVNVPNDSEKNSEAFLEQIDKLGVTVDIVGFAYHFDLIYNETKEPYFIFKNGSNLFSIQNIDKIKDWTPNGIKKFIAENASDFPVFKVSLKAPINFGLPITKLRTSKEDWEEFLYWICNRFNLKKI